MSNNFEIVLYNDSFICNKLLIFITLLLSVLVSCQEESSPTDSSEESPELSYDPASFEVSGEAGTVELNIQNSGDGTLEWEISSNESWISINPNSGTNNETITITYEENLTQKKRIANIGFTSNAGNDSLSFSQESLVGNVSGMVRAWGSNNYGQTEVPSDLTDVIAISAGGYHSLALKKDGSVRAWGDNRLDQSFVPLNVFPNIIAISAGASHNVVLSENGAVQQWGGGGETFLDSVPSPLANITAIAAGFNYSLALHKNGAVVGWGDTNLPSGLPDITSISAGLSYIVLAVKEDGLLLAWEEDGLLLPVPPNLTNISDISVGGTQALALKEDGTVVAWFWDDNFDVREISLPSDVTNVVAVAAGLDQNLALKEDGSVIGWNNFGNKTSTPSDLENVIAISCGLRHCLALIGDN